MTSRESFEAQIRKQFPIASDDLLIGRSSNGRYGSMVTEHAWQAWQAATDAALERAAEVCQQISALQLREECIRTADSCAEAIRALKDAE